MRGQQSPLHLYTILILTTVLFATPGGSATTLLDADWPACVASAGAADISDRAIAAPLTVMMSRFIVVHSMFGCVFRGPRPSESGIFLAQVSADRFRHPIGQGFVVALVKKVHAPFDGRAVSARGG